MTVEGEDICETCAQFVEDGNLPSASFVHNRYTHSVSERAGTIDEDSVDVLDTGVVADIVVGDVVMDIVEVRLVAHFAVMQHRVIDTRVDLDTSGQFYLFAVHA